jgi:hypothetical protein
VAGLLLKELRGVIHWVAAGMIQCLDKLKVKIQKSKLVEGMG